MIKEHFKNFVESNPHLVTRKESTAYPGLFVLKYKRKVFYDALWTPELELCRGLVLDANWDVVVRPFTKIYNRGENNTDIPLDDISVVVEKKNGFMCAVTYHPNHGCIVSTTGSLDSDFVALARPYVEPFFDYIETVGVGTELSRGCQLEGIRHTWLFEICSPEDPHIIPEKEGAWLIGAQVCKYSDAAIPECVLDIHARNMGAKRPKWIRARFGSVVEEIKDCRHEGYVIHGSNGTSLKIKSPYYLTKKALARGNFDKICAGAKDRIDEEYYPLIDHLKGLGDGFTTLDEQGKLTVIREFLSKG